MDQYYTAADLAVKQQIISSMYPEKLIFENNEYRTPRINEVVKLILLNSNELEGKKNGTENRK